MATARPGTLTGFLVVALAACGGSSDTKGISNDAASDVSRPSAGSTGAAGMSLGAGGGGGGNSGSAGSAGSPMGMGGRGGGGGAPVDAGRSDTPAAAADAAIGADAGSPPRDVAPFCAVVVTPVIPGRFLDLPSGPTSRLVVRGELTGNAIPGTPRWTWTIMHDGVTTIPSTPVDGNPAQVQFPLVQPGRYLISVRVDGGTPICRGTGTANALHLDELTADYLVRVTGSAGSVMPPQEARITIAAGRAKTQNLVFDTQATSALELDPQTGDELSVAIPSYIRITSPRSTIRFEGSNDTRPFAVQLNPALPWDVLVIPVRATVAPMFYEQMTLAALRAQLPLKLDPGAAVSGRLSAASGPVEGARVLLRSKVLPSTFGAANAMGAFALRARPGVHSLIVLPPPGSSLSEARIDDVIEIASPAPPMTRIDFRWQTVPMVNLAVVVLTPDGMVPASPVRVRLESDPAGIPRAATLTVNDFATDVAGVLRVDTVTAGNLASFADLPRAVYRVTLFPAADDRSGSAITVATINLAANARAMWTVPFVRRVKVTGRLVNAKLDRAGVRLIAFDTAADLAVASPAALLDAGGRYELMLDPGRSYRLFVDPDPVRALPRSPLGGVTAPVSDKVLDDRSLPSGVVWSGQVTYGGSQPQAGAVLQAYCIGDAPDCVDPGSIVPATARPVAETVSDGDGGFHLVLPDPGTSN